MWSRPVLIVLVIAAMLPASSIADAKQRSAKDQALRDKAIKDCSSPKRALSARPFINYSGGWYRCVESESKR